MLTMPEDESTQEPTADPPAPDIPTEPIFSPELVTSSQEPPPEHMILSEPPAMPTLPEGTSEPPDGND